MRAVARLDRGRCECTWMPASMSLTAVGGLVENVDGREEWFRMSGVWGPHDAGSRGAWMGTAHKQPSVPLREREEGCSAGIAHQSPTKAMNRPVFSIHPLAGMRETRRPGRKSDISRARGDILALKRCGSPRTGGEGAEPQPRNQRMVPITNPPDTRLHLVLGTASVVPRMNPRGWTSNTGADRRSPRREVGTRGRPSSWSSKAVRVERRPSEAPLHAATQSAQPCIRTQCRSEQVRYILIGRAEAGEPRLC